MNRLELHQVQGLKFDELLYDQDNQVAELIYKYQKKTLVYCINASYRDSSFGLNVDDKKIEEYEEQIKGHTITIKKYIEKEKKEDRMIASFREKGIEYYMIGAMNSKDFKKILNNLFFPK